MGTKLAIVSLCSLLGMALESFLFSTPNLWLGFIAIATITLAQVMED